jgi:hypothetical protein
MLLSWTKILTFEISLAFLQFYRTNLTNARANRIENLDINSIEHKIQNKEKKRKRKITTHKTKKIGNMATTKKKKKKKKKGSSSCFS